ncbi:MAG: hypothetical protein LBT59_15465, partial [Clostridiales bacterium]|nr:hypothetical protein [Clostridiales bacterium]
LFAISVRDWLKYDIPELKVKSIADFPDDFSSSIKESQQFASFSKVINKYSVYHWEPLGHVDYDLPLRMTRHMSDLSWYYARQTGPDVGKEICLYQTAVLFSPRFDYTKSPYYIWDDFIYKIVKLWEIDPQKIIDAKLVGLYPLIPLMDNKQSASTPDLVHLSVDAIVTVNNERWQKKMLKIMSFMTENVKNLKIIWD